MCSAFIERLHPSVDSVGGLSFGADPIAIGISMLSGLPWFSVRKEQKAHGMKNTIDGKMGRRVAIVDDVVTSGRSIDRAIVACVHYAQVQQVLALVGRSNKYPCICTLEQIREQSRSL